MIGNIGLFWENVGLFSENVGNISENLGLFGFGKCRGSFFIRM